LAEVEFAAIAAIKRPATRPHRSKSLIHVNRHFRINQIVLDRLGKVGVHQ
jgi:hypothetical protein